MTKITKEAAQYYRSTPMRNRVKRTKNGFYLMGESETYGQAFRRRNRGGY